MSRNTSVEPITVRVTPHGTAHSVAADPIFNQIYVPIPNTAGLNVCSNAGGSDGQGCIAVFTAAHDDQERRATSTVAKRLLGFATASLRYCVRELRAFARSFFFRN